MTKMKYGPRFAYVGQGYAGQSYPTKTTKADQKRRRFQKEKREAMISLAKTGDKDAIEWLKRWTLNAGNNLALGRKKPTKVKFSWDKED